MDGRVWTDEGLPAHSWASLLAPASLPSHSPALHLVLSQLGRRGLDPHASVRRLPRPPRLSAASRPGASRPKLSYRSLSPPVASCTSRPLLASGEQRVSPPSRRPRGTGSCSDQQGIRACLSQRAARPWPLPPQVGHPQPPRGGRGRVLGLPLSARPAPLCRAARAFGAATTRHQVWTGLRLPQKHVSPPWGRSRCRMPRARHRVGAIEPWAPRLLPRTPRAAE